MPDNTEHALRKRGWTPIASHNDIRKCGVCEAEFVAKRYNTKYCSAKCQKIQNNKISLDAYFKKKDIKSGKTKRRCKNSDCNIILSRYNKEKYCGPCARKNFIARLTKWGFDPVEAEQHWLIND